MVFINTAVVGKVTAPLYRNGGEGFAVYIYVRNARGKDVLVASLKGTRSECVAFRNSAVLTAGG